jgi:hypothetical protein
VYRDGKEKEKEKERETDVWVLTTPETTGSSTAAGAYLRDSI